jgi:hypothetical protein
MENIYRYTPLKSGQIRVFVIDFFQPLGSLLSGRLETVNLESGYKGWLFLRGRSRPSHGFDTLSYVWGNPTKRHILRLDDKPIMIHTNLQQALYQLREMHIDRPIWTDAICINQADSEKRLSQIVLMHKIYQKAAHVWAWLSTAMDEIATAVQLIPFLCRIASLARDRGYSGQIRDLRSRVSIQTWSALRRIVRNSYFDRLWILQEACLANEVCFLCGPYRVNWKTMVELFELKPYLMQIEGFLDLTVSSPNLLSQSVFNMKIFIELQKNQLKQYRPLIRLSRLIFRMFGGSGTASPENNLSQEAQDPLLGFLKDISTEYLRALLYVSRRQKCSEP